MSTAKDFKTCLLFPPQWIPINPHMAICSLAGHLREKGYPVKIFDLNVKFYRTILTPEHLRYSMEKVFNAHNYLDARINLGLARKENQAEFAFETAWFLEIDKKMHGMTSVWQDVADNILEAVAVFDDEEKFYKPFNLVKAFVTIDKAMELISLPYYPTRLQFNNLYTPQCPFTLEHLINFTGDRQQNVVYPFLKKELKNMLAENADLYAISINSSSQVVPGLTLARLIKEKVGKKAHVTIGGNYFARVKDTFLEKPDFFKYFADTLILNEGEEPFTKLIEFLQGEASIMDVPRLLFFNKAKNKTIFTFDKKPPKMDEIGTQDLADLPLDQYFTPEIVLSTRASKGCYWQKCTFCDAFYGVEPDNKNLDAFYNELKTMKEKYGIKHFEFIDESIFPDFTSELSRRIIDENLGISWFCNARTEEIFTHERLKQYHDAGLKMILWGIETGSKRILDLINKGVDFNKRLDVLKNSTEAGIWNFAFLFFGFPSETREDAMSTINMIIDNKEIIHSYGKSIFTMGKHSKIAEKAKELGLVKAVENPQELNTDFYFAYDSATGLNRQQVYQMSDLCRVKCHEAYGDPLWMYLRNREFMHLYISKFGMDYVYNFDFTDKEKEDIKFLYARRFTIQEIMEMLNQDSP
jgi:anaerobic magnesium-protoporphyrin IX monomethyl ester cyclase